MASCLPIYADTRPRLDGASLVSDREHQLFEPRLFLHSGGRGHGVHGGVDSSQDCRGYLRGRDHRQALLDAACLALLKPVQPQDQIALEGGRNCDLDALRGPIET